MPQNAFQTFIAILLGSGQTQPNKPLTVDGSGNLLVSLAADAEAAPVPVAPAVVAGGTTPATLQVDAEGNLLTSQGDTASHLNVTAATVIKATPGRLGKITVSAPGTTSGALTINDCATTGAAAAANQIVSIPFASLTAGQVINLDWPCAVGIVVSAVPGGGSPVYAVSYT